MTRRLLIACCLGIAGSAQAQQAAPILRMLQTGQITPGQVLRMVQGRQEVVNASSLPTPIALSSFQREVLAFARQCAAQPRSPLRAFALHVLARLGSRQDVALVRPYLGADNVRLRLAAMTALWLLNPAAGRGHARNRLTAPSPLIVRNALRIFTARPDDRVDLDDEAGADRAPMPVYVGELPCCNPERVEQDERDATREAVAAAQALAQHPSPIVRREVCAVLLSFEVRQDYSAFLPTLLSARGGSPAAQRVLRVLRQRWPRVPAEFWPLLRRECRGGNRPAALPLVPRVDADAVPFRSRAERREFEQLRQQALAPRTQPATTDRTGYSLAFFYQRGCGQCQHVHKWIVRLANEIPDLRVRRYDIRQMDAAVLNEILSERMELPNRKRQTAPAVFTSTGALVGSEIDEDRLLRLVLASRGQPPPWPRRGAGSELDVAAAQERIQARYARLTAPWVVAAGLADGVNPCAFTVIIFFLSYLYYLGRGRAQVLMAGLAFTAGVFATYLLVGFGLLGAVQALRVMPALSAAVYWATAGLTLAAAVLSLRDGVLCLRGQSDRMVLKLPAAAQGAIHRVIRTQTRLRTIVAASLVAGFAVSLLELACTGQIYLPTILFISKGPARGAMLLVLYNVAFIAPLLAIFLLAYFGLGSQALAGFLRRHVAAAKFLMAGMFAALCVLLVVSV